MSTDPTTITSLSQTAAVVYLAVIATYPILLDRVQLQLLCEVPDSQRTTAAALWGTRQSNNSYSCFVGYQTVKEQLHLLQLLFTLPYSPSYGRFCAG